MFYKTQLLDETVPALPFHLKWLCPRFFRQSHLTSREMFPGGMFLLALNQTPVELGSHISLQPNTKPNIGLLIELHVMR